MTNQINQAKARNLERAANLGKVESLERAMNLEKVGSPRRAVNLKIKRFQSGTKYPRSDTVCKSLCLKSELVAKIKLNLKHAVAVIMLRVSSAQKT